MSARSARTCMYLLRQAAQCRRRNRKEHRRQGVEELLLCHHPCRIDAGAANHPLATLAPRGSSHPGHTGAAIAPFPRPQIHKLDSDQPLSYPFATQPVMNQTSVPCDPLVALRPVLQNHLLRFLSESFRIFEASGFPEAASFCYLSDLSDFALTFARHKPTFD